MRLKTSAPRLKRVTIGAEFELSRDIESHKTSLLRCDRFRVISN
jgi:hypothetical protein